MPAPSLGVHRKPRFRVVVFEGREKTRLSFAWGGFKTYLGNRRALGDLRNIPIRFAVVRAICIARSTGWFARVNVAACKTGNRQRMDS